MSTGSLILKVYTPIVRKCITQVVALTFLVATPILEKINCTLTSKPRPTPPWLVSWCKTPSSKATPPLPWLVSWCKTQGTTMAGLLHGAKHPLVRPHHHHSCSLCAKHPQAGTTAAASYHALLDGLLLLQFIVACSNVVWFYQALIFLSKDSPHVHRAGDWAKKLLQVHS
jgi:hypothetical protein